MTKPPPTLPNTHSLDPQVAWRKSPLIQTPTPSPRNYHATVKEDDRPPELTCRWDSDSDDETDSLSLHTTKSTNASKEDTSVEEQKDTTYPSTRRHPCYLTDASLHLPTGITHTHGNSSQRNLSAPHNPMDPPAPEDHDFHFTQGSTSPNASTPRFQRPSSHAPEPSIPLPCHDNPHARRRPAERATEPSRQHTYIVPTQVLTATTQIIYPPVNCLHPVEGQRALHNNCYVGDNLSLPKNEGITHLYFQNINGVNLSTVGNWEDTCSHLRDMEVDIALIAEHKLDTTQRCVLKKLYDQARKVLGLGSFTINATSTPTESPTMYKPGGVLSLTNGGTKGCILTSGNDPLGRWAYNTYRRSSGPPITVVVTYQVVKVDPRRAGPTTYATQLFSEYLKDGRQHPDKLRRHHASNLLTFIKQCQERGEWIIIAGDMNKVLGVDDSGMTKLHRECGLLDACLERHGITDFTTYQRGHKVIDYILVDRNVMQCIQSVGYEPFNIHIMSNHRGIFIDLATPQCFGSNIQQLQPMQIRDLSTKRSHQLAPYFTAKQKHLEDHRWYHKIRVLQDKMKHDILDHELVEDLYE